MEGEPIEPIVITTAYDDDVVLTLRSSEGNLFEIGQARARQSEVWKKMLQVDEAGEGKKRKAAPAFGAGDEIEVKNEKLEVVELEENDVICDIFLESLKHGGWAKQSLTPKQVVKLLRLAEKFEALMPALYIPSMIEIIPLKWDLEDVLLVYHYSGLLNLQTLKNVAARNFVRLGDIVDHPIDQEKIKVAAHHLLELHVYRKKWLDQSEVKFTRLEGCRQNKECEALWNNEGRLGINKGKGLKKRPRDYDFATEKSFCDLHQQLQDQKEVLDSFTL